MGPWSPCPLRWARHVAPLLLIGACSATPTDRPLESAATWSVDSVPILSIGSPKGDTTAPIGVAVAAYAVNDSEVVVADRGYYSLRYFDHSGRLMRTVGRRGDGPGEFEYQAWAFRCGDSLFVQDIGHMEMMVFGLDGGFARTYRPTGPSPRFDLPYKMACGPDQTFLNNGWDTVRVEKTSRVRGSTPYWLSDATGVVTRVLGSWPGSERLASPRGSRPFPLGKEPVMAVGRTRAYIGTADSFAIMVFDLDGNPLPAIAEPRAELATTPADIDRYKLLDTLGKSDDYRQREIREWKTFQFPPTVPAYTAMVVDRADNLWVRAFPRSTANVVRWLIFDDSGKRIGSLDLPATFGVFEIGPDWILGIDTALLDGSQWVKMYRYRKG